ncbi:MAG: hypothetical protein NTZ49_05590 [Candidatus Parcubacteria bacterium]|nr:hypothetical protein [Candidatus Parcubacteria bacterium]
MITGDILKSISAKLGGIVWHMIIVGLLFFILAMAILFYPQKRQKNNFYEEHSHLLFPHR